MLNLINRSDRNIELGNSSWMYIPTPNSGYHSKFEFVLFNNQDEIEFLDGKGELVRKNSLEFDHNGIYRERKTFNVGFEFVNAQQINLMLQLDFPQSHENREVRYTRLKLIKLIPTKLEVDEEEIAKIMTDSHWVLNSRFAQNVEFDFVPWEKRSQEQLKEDIFAKTDEKRQKHLIKIKDSLIIITQRFDQVDAKSLLSKVTDKEIILVDHKRDYEEFILKRKQ